MLYLYGIGELVHNVQLLEGQNTHALDEGRQAIRCPLALAIVLRLQQYSHQLRHQLRALVSDGRHQWVEAVGHSFLNLWNGRLEPYRTSSM